MLYDLIFDDHSHDMAEMSDEDKAILFGDAPVPEPSDEELEAMAAEHEAREAVDFDGRADGHRDSNFWVY